MGASVVNEEQVTDVDLGQHTVARKLVGVLAEPAHHVVAPGCGLALVTHHGDVVVGAVDGRAHEVGGAGVDAQVVVVGDLLVDHTGHKAARRRQHPAAKLGSKGHVTHTRGNENLLVHAAHALAHGSNVHGNILGAVVDANAAGEVNQPHVHAKLARKTDGQLEEHARKARVVVLNLRV